LIQGVEELNVVPLKAKVHTVPQLSPAASNEICPAGEARSTSLNVSGTETSAGTTIGFPRVGWPKYS
jgi:hypothetical protein